jgi:type I restriction enzyme R subunit
MPLGPEDIAREQIDRMLMSAGWAVQDAKAVNLYAKRGVAIREFELKTGYGTSDYLLCNYIDLTPSDPKKFVHTLKPT